MSRFSRKCGSRHFTTLWASMTIGIHLSLLEKIHSVTFHIIHMVMIQFVVYSCSIWSICNCGAAVRFTECVDLSIYMHDKVFRTAGVILIASRPTLGPAQHHIQWVLGALSPGVKRLWHEADHSPPSSAKVKKRWSYTSTLPYVFMV
jgi:hypothetical protein